MYRVLVEQAPGDKIINDAGGDAPPPQVGAYAPVIPVGRGKDERGTLLPGRRPGLSDRRGSGEIHGVAAVFQQVADGLGEGQPVEVAEEVDCVATDELRVAPPCAAVLDPQAVHLPGGVVAADAPDLIAQGSQQLRQVGVLGGVYLRIRVMPVRRAGGIYG